MDRTTNTSEQTHHSRTAQWVAAQADEVYDPVRSQPPSPVLAMATVRYPRDSKRTTASSEQSIATTSTSAPRRQRDRQGSLPPPYAGPVTNYSAALPHHTVRETPRGERRRMPFPQSPPGSGYPLMLQVDPPRAPLDGGSMSQGKVRPTAPVLRIAEFSDWLGHVCSCW